MERIQKAVSATTKMVNDIFDSSSSEEEEEDDEKKKKKKQHNKQQKVVDTVPADTKRTKSKNDKDGDASSSTDTEEMAGEIVADVFTGGLYGTVAMAVDSVDGLVQANKEKKEIGVGRLTVKEAFEVVADVMSGGIYGAVGADEGDEEKDKKNEDKEKKK
mmetsp:Transcript_23221/g.44229  ORF Transcript_23221/g.44229 Transcript_23221/m.44229 type:complete len:160 (-) Transcript_23221:373-852(-)|eukprot:scaffold5479_cov199-Amphora_coffeaeformis.AAC.75